jgi:hypothetical protein
MNQKIKISQLPAKGSNLAAADLLEIAEFTGTGYISKSITGQELIDAIPLPPSGITIGTTAITSGTVGRVLFEGTGNVVQESANLFWDNTNGRLGIGMSSPTVTLDAIGNEFKFAATSGNINFYSTPGVNSHFNFINIRQDSDYIFKQNRGGILNTTSLVLKGNTGNVLINTTTDAGYRLDVNGTARVSGILSLSSATGGYAYLQDTSVNSAYNVISLQNTSGAFAIISRTSTGGYVAGHYGIVQTSAASSYQRWFTSGVERMRMDATGNVGIGTSSPAYPLHITRNSSSNYIQLSGNSNKGLFAEGSGLIAFDTSGNFNVYTGGVNQRATIANRQATSSSEHHH